MLSSSLTAALFPPLGLLLHLPKSSSNSPTVRWPFEINLPSSWRSPGLSGQVRFWALNGSRWFKRGVAGANLMYYFKSTTLTTTVLPPVCPRDCLWQCVHLSWPEPHHCEEIHMDKSKYLLLHACYMSIQSIHIFKKNMNWPLFSRWWGCLVGAMEYKDHYNIPIFPGFHPHTSFTRVTSCQKARM